MTISIQRIRQRLGILCALVFTAFIWILVDWTTIESFTTPGPMNTGHADLVCLDCHQAERGTLRQQGQAALSHWRGARDDAVFVGTRPVVSGACLACHDRPNDRHPIYRFREPRFAEARENLGADECISCHEEHLGVRVTQSPDFCATCHDGLEMKNDPLDVPHADLVSQANWTSCLTCHDFHGNHIYDTPTHMADAYSSEAVKAYLQGEQELYPARRTLP